MKIKSVITTVVTVAALLAVSLQPVAAKDKAEYTLKICHLTSEQDPMHQGFAYLKDLLEEKTDGRIQVEIFGNASIASSDVETAEKVQQNICQMTAGPAYAAAALGNIPELKIFDYPYLFENYEDLYKLLDSDLFKEWAANLESQTGVIMKGGYTLGWNAIMDGKKELNSYKDLEKLKIRTMSTDLQMAFINALGASATPIAYGETYTACQQGTVDVALVFGRIARIGQAGEREASVVIPDPAGRTEDLRVALHILIVLRELEGE